MWDKRKFKYISTYRKRRSFWWRKTSLAIVRMLFCSKCLLPRKKQKHFQITNEEQKRRKIYIKDQRTSQRLGAAYKTKSWKNLIQLELQRYIWHIPYIHHCSTCTCIYYILHGKNRHGNWKKEPWVCAKASRL